jgi:sigma-B regulation protein RsbU (phosphoserine phosphatase)
VSAGDARNLILELRTPARAGELKRIRDAVRKTVKAAGCGKECTGDIVMAVDEACQNIIRHAYGKDRNGEIVLEIERQAENLVFSLVDFAPRIDPARVKPRNLDDVRPGGLGTHLIRKVMDSADFIEPPPGCGNLLRMIKRIE